MSTVILAGLSLLVLSASALPLISKADELLTDLNAAGNFMAAYVKTYPEYMTFYQMGLPIGVTFTLAVEQRREAMMTIYSQYGPKNASSQQMLNDVNMLLSTIETTKDEYLVNYFPGNTTKGLQLISRAGYLFSEDYYLEAQFVEKKEMLKKLVDQFI